MQIIMHKHSINKLKIIWIIEKNQAIWEMIFYIIYFADNFCSN